jgi:uncharacterized protein (TIGR03083 family)
VRDTAIRVEDIVPINHKEGMALAETEYRRYTDVLGQLRPGDWAVQTVNTDWNVKQLTQHMLGFAESNASFRVFVEAMLAGKKRAKVKGYDHFVHGTNEVQVEERDHLTTDELVAQWKATWPKALKGRRRFPPFMRPIPLDFGPVIGKKPMGSYLMDVVFTRDTWMHRIDTCRAVGLEPVLTTEHDGRLIEDMVAEWTKLYDLSITLHLEGPAGAAYVRGTGNEELTIDAVEWIWILSGRATSTGLLKKELPL